MQELLGFLQLSLLNQRRDASQLVALGACDYGQAEKRQRQAGTCESLGPHAGAQSVSGTMMAAARVQCNPLLKSLTDSRKTN